MRQERTVQATIFEIFAQHEIGCELKVMSQWLDGQRLIGLVAGDLWRQGVRQTWRRGLPAESVLRCAVLKQQRQLSYDELAFHLEDSASFRAFARLPLAWTPKKSVLHHTIAAICAEGEAIVSTKLNCCRPALPASSGPERWAETHTRGADGHFNGLVHLLQWFPQIDSMPTDSGANCSSPIWRRRTISRNASAATVSL